MQMRNWIIRKLGGFTYEQMIAAGWTDDQLRTAGMML